ncbi:MAG: hypothetical protein ACI9YL_001168 [Luteibaculaceae bacterium]|jgi:hypothetical protein
MPLITLQVLIDHEEDVFRRISIDTSNTLEELHLAILHAFNFNGDQMASFFQSDENWEKGEEFALMAMDEKTNSMADTTVESLSLTKGSRMLYVYDFLRMWCFYIEVLDLKKGSQEFPITEYSFGVAPKEEEKDMDFGDEMALLNPDGNKNDLSADPYGEDDMDNLTDSDMFDSLDDMDHL